MIAPASGELWTAEQAAAPYANSLVFLFLGGFLIGLGMQRWGLHRRMALLVLRAAGSDTRRLVGAFMLVSALLSMWISNTATAIMLLPIATSLLASIDASAASDRRADVSADGAIGSALLLGIAYSSSIGGAATLIGTLALKPAWSTRFETGISPERLEGLTRLSRWFDELLNRAPEPQAPYVGSSAFATKAGIHASALIKEPETYEHVPPRSVGNKRRVMVSDQGGKANFVAELKRRGIPVDKADRRLDTLIALVKEREAQGYAYEGADASFDLLARRTLGKVPEFFRVTSFRCMVERRFDANGALKTVSEAIVKVIVDGEERMSVAEGHGPVNALDIALRKDLGKFQSEIEDLELADYKVRILNGGTEAITRVLIESHDASGARWWTVGVSDNIIDASFQALMDSIVYKLVKNRDDATSVAAAQ